MDKKMKYDAMNNHKEMKKLLYDDVKERTKKNSVAKGYTKEK